MTDPGLPRYSFAGDDAIFVEMSRDFDLVTNFKIQAICKSITEEAVPGFIEAYPGNTAYMVLLDPEAVSPDHLLGKMRKIESRMSELIPFESRLIEIPVLYNDPWTIACAKEFPSNHQDPSVTNIEYVAQLNGMSVPELIKAHSHSQYLVTMKRFLPGSLCLYQMVDRSQALSCPKYLVPRSWGPVRALVMGGIFSTIAPYRGPGGYQFLGRSPVPVYDAERKLPDLKDSTLASSGDRFKLSPIDMDEYKDTRAKVKAGSYRYKIVKQSFDPKKYLADQESYLEKLEDELRHV